jgi:hypothetical protein
MPFSNPDFPGRVFSTTDELQTAIRESKRIESELVSQADDEEILSVTATIIPAPQQLLEQRILVLERQLLELTEKLEERQERTSTLNKDRLPIGMVLKGDSKGKTHKLEILDNGYLCESGEIAATLSAAAEEVSGNRRSGWAFWTDGQGTPIGEITGRFNKHELRDPFGAVGV